MVEKIKLLFDKENILDTCICIVFGLAFFSIPVCSFSVTLKYVTWGLTSVFALLCIFVLIFKNPLKINIISMSLFLFPFCAVISSALNGFVNFNFTPILLSLLALIIYEYCICKKNNENKLLFAAYLGNILFLFVFIIRYRNELIHLNFTRLGSLFGDQNDISLFMAFGYLISIYFIFFVEKISIKITAGIFAMIFFVCGLSCGSKIFVLIFLACSILILFMKLGKKKLWLSFLLTAAFIGLFIGFINLPFMATIKNRILSFFDFFIKSDKSTDHTDYSTLERIHMFTCGINMFLRKPAFGYGVWGFANFASLNNGWSHNHISECLCNFGSVGFFIFHIPIGFALYSFFKHPKTTNHKLGISLVVFFLLSMISVSLITEKIYAFLIGPIVAMFVMPQEQRCFNFIRVKTNEKTC